MKKLIVAAAVCCVLPLAGFAGSPMYGVGGGGVQKVTSGQTASIATVSFSFNVRGLTMNDPNDLEITQFQPSVSLQTPVIPCKTNVQANCPAEFTLDVYKGYNMQENNKSNCQNNICTISKAVTTPQLNTLNQQTWANMTANAQVYVFGSNYTPSSNPAAPIGQSSQLTCYPGAFNSAATTINVDINSAGTCTLNMT